MAQVLVRNLSNEVLERLKQRARREGRSLQSEVKQILEQAAGATSEFADARKVAARIRRSLQGRRHSDSSQLIAEDRAR